MTITDQREANRAAITAAFEAWRDGTGLVADLFAPEMTWEILGRSVAARRYVDAADFIDAVLKPFALRFPAETPFRPIEIRRVLSDGDTVMVLWHGRGLTVEDTVYDNNYVWMMTMRDGQIIDGTALFDSIAFNTLWQVTPRAA